MCGHYHYYNCLITLQVQAHDIGICVTYFILKTLEKIISRMVLKNFDQTVKKKKKYNN